MRVIRVNQKTFNLTKIKSPFIDETVEADKYYLIRKNNKIIGGFAYTVLSDDTVELQGVFKKYRTVKNLFTFIMNFLNGKKIILYCFEALIPLYSKYSFKEEERYPFNTELAPSEWDIRTLGKQSVVKMVA